MASFAAGLGIGLALAALAFFGIVLRAMKPLGWVVVCGLMGLLLWNL